MDAMKNNQKKNHKGQGVFSFLFRDDIGYRERSDDGSRENSSEPLVICAPKSGMGSMDLGCIVATHQSMTR